MLLFTQNKEKKKNEFNIQYSGKKELEALRAEFGGFHTGQVCCGPSPILFPARPRSVGLVSHLILAFAIIVRHHKCARCMIGSIYCFFLFFLFIWSYYAHQSEGHLGLLYVRRKKAAFKKAIHLPLRLHSLTCIHGKSSPMSSLTCILFN